MKQRLSTFPAGRFPDPDRPRINAATRTAALTLGVFVLAVLAAEPAHASACNGECDSANAVVFVKAAILIPHKRFLAFLLGMNFPRIRFAIFGVADVNIPATREFFGSYS